MTEKEKAIEDETIELPTGPAEKKKPHRGRIVVITVFSQVGVSCFVTNFFRFSA